MRGSLDLDLLLKAYASGIFPMADDRTAGSVYWVEPKTRGILPLDGFHLSRSLARTLKSGAYETSVNAAFGDVISACAEPADDRPSTWINGQIEQAVQQLHLMGHAHSVETWQDGHLVGGLYGIALGRAFFGESMFSRATDASKVALAHLVARLRHGGFTLLDCQFITPHLESLGALEISRSAYMKLLNAALVPESPLGDFLIYSSSPESSAETSPSRAISVSAPISGWRIWQDLTQTS
jgi:leucyl/phenylalanyl-tRNA---protein transferase